MTIEYVCYKARKWNLDKVHSYLTQEGFEKEEIERIISIKEDYKRFIEAGKAFCKLNWHNFSMTQLAMLAVDWEKQRGRNLISYKLNDIYKEDREKLNKLYNLNTNCMQLFREETDNYKGNLQKARRVWPNFVPQKHDWKNGITLPLEINRKVARFLGIAWIDGSLNIPKDAKNPDNLSLQGRKTDTELYTSFVSPVINELFNYQVKIAKGGRERSTKIKKEIVYFNDYSYPIIKIGSTAVSTWLYNDIRMELTQNNIKRKLPNLDWNDKDVKGGYLEGVIAACGRVGKRDLGFEKRDSYFCNALKELFSLNGIRFSEYNRSLHIRKNEMSSIRSKYIFINPSHAN